MDIHEKYEYWLTFDDNTKNELESITDKKEIEDRFYKDLEFGTGGLRGIMGAGANRMNKYTVGKATKGLCEYLKNEFAGEKSVVIAYDSRNNSKAFAARRSIWPITRKLAPIRRCDDARHHRSCERPGGAGHWHKGADRSGFGAIRRYPCGVGRGSAANIPANADWRDCQPTGWQEEVRTDWGELLRRFRN